MFRAAGQLQEPAFGQEGYSVPTFGFMVDIQEFLSLFFGLPVRRLIADHQKVRGMAHPILNERSRSACQLLGLGAK
jgi:hypothetical protein